MDVVDEIYYPDQKFCIVSRSDRKIIQYCMIYQQKLAGTK